MDNAGQAAARVAESLRPWKPEWTLIVQLATHVQARAFGFQIVNSAQEEVQKGQCIAASSSAAADHLLQLLRDRVALAMDGKPERPDLEYFTKAVDSLHEEYFTQGPYEEWKRKSRVKSQFGLYSQQVDISSQPGWIHRLAELALYFMLWTEATNLKHTPELLWLFYYIMLNSHNMTKACQVLGSPGGCYSVLALSTGTSPLCRDKRALEHGFVKGVLLPTRNQHGNAMRLGKLVLDGPNPYRPSQQQQQAQGSNSLAARQRAGLERLLAAGASLSDVIAFDLHYFGDGCIFLDMVVQPVFNFLAEQVGLMGQAGEQPALRLGYDDVNESACIAQVLNSLKRKLDTATGEDDAWGRLLKFFIATDSKDLASPAVSEEDVHGDLSRCQNRYPRKDKRLAGMAKALKKAAELSPGDEGYGCVGGSAPTSHLLKSIHVTNALWGELFKKSFLETRSMGAVAVAFSRVYIMHAVMLCWMTLWAYMIPRNAFTITAMFTGKYEEEGPDPNDQTKVTTITKYFYWEHGMTLAECASWGLLVHAVLHVVKDILMIQLLWAPSAVRVCRKADGGSQQGSWFKRGRSKSVIPSADNKLQEGDTWVEVAPKVHNSRLLQLHNLATLLFWLGCCFLLLDSHMERWPLHAFLVQKGFTDQVTDRTKLPVWALYGLVYVGLWVVHQMWYTVMEVLPERVGGFVAALFRKDGRRPADFFFPYGNMSSSQDFKRSVINNLLWVVVIFIKFLFDFFVVLQPLAEPAHKLIDNLNGAQPAPWGDWAMSVILIFALWGASAFLVFYDTGLFWQLVGALYSTLILGIHRRVGHVKSWSDLVLAFPNLDRKAEKRLLPNSHTAFAADQHGGYVPVQSPKSVHMNGINGVNGKSGLDTQNSKDAGPVPAARAARGPSPFAEIPPCSNEEALFAEAWNKVIDDLRQRDLLSNLERDRLNYVEVCSGGGKHGGWWLLPRFVAAGAVTEVTSSGVTAATQIVVISRSMNMLLWLMKEMKVLGAGEASHLLLAASGAASMLAQKTENRAPKVAGASDVEAAAEVLKDSKELLEKLKKKLSEKKNVSLSDVDTELLLEATFKNLMAILKKSKNTVRQFDRSKLDVPKEWNSGDYAQLPAQRQMALKVISWLLDMLQLTHGDAAPATHEARRVLCFFATSLHNPKMHRADTVACTRSMTTLTPHYGEDVMYALSKDVAQQEMGLKGLSGGDDNTFLLDTRDQETDTLRYLKVVYKAEWRNFIERLTTRSDVQLHLQQNDIKLPADIGPATFGPDGDLHPWLHEMLTFASMRGQLLQRTVHGMMYYETALQQLILMQCRAELENKARAEAAGLDVTLRDRNQWVKQVCEEAALLLAQKKFAYVVSSQNLGEFSYDGNVGKRWLTHCIRNVLAKRYPSLKIAYIDLENIAEAPMEDVQDPRTGRKLSAYCRLVPSAGDGKGAHAMDIAPRKRTKGSDKNYPKLLYRQYSVLLQWDEQAQCVKEMYRVRLPVNLETETGVILGEGKPENQNHAAIFCHSETLQTIDCNQDGYLVEALKLPNLLREFEGRNGRSIRSKIRPVQNSSSGRRWHKHSWTQGPALVGFREWVFSEDSGAMAEFAAATERSFGTTVQRVMHNPGGVRFHYGHPDVWDKLFTMTNGGVSKSTKSLHVSEDVFGGYNVMMRGRDITYVDYHAVGKGRDMGFETILAFEGKIAGGNGEQVVSRDIQRLGRRLNFARLMSWYHTGNGFFINTGLLMFSLLVNAWLVLLIGLSTTTPTGATLGNVLGLLGGLQFMQLGSLSLLVYVATVWLEDGLIPTLKNVLKQIAAGSLLFYVFRGQTTAYYFVGDVKYGGAKYAATGRGYKLQATPFIDLFQQYVRSHMWFGAHLLLLLIMALGVGLKISFFALWSYIIVIAALLCAPFWFNPFTWDWDRNRVAAREFSAWMAGHKPAGKSKVLWRVFNQEQLKQAADDDEKQIGRLFKNICGSVWLLPIGVSIAFAIVGMLDAEWKSLILVGVVNGLIILLAACWWFATKLESMKGSAFMSRIVKFLVKFLVLGGLIVMFAFVLNPTQRHLFRVMMRVLYIEFELARLLSMFLLNFFPSWQPARRLVNKFCWIADFVVGVVLLLLLFIGSLFGLLTRYQAAVLFGEGYSKYYLSQEALKTSEVGRLAEEIRAIKKKQKRAGNKPSGGSDDHPSGGGGGGGGGGDNGGGGGGGGTAAGPRAHAGDATTPPSSRAASAVQDDSQALQILSHLTATAEQAGRSAKIMLQAGSRTIRRVAEGDLELTDMAARADSSAHSSPAHTSPAHSSPAHSSPGRADTGTSKPALTEPHRVCSVTRGATGSRSTSPAPRSSTPSSTRVSASGAGPGAAGSRSASPAPRSRTPDSRRVSAGGDALGAVGGIQFSPVPRSRTPITDRASTSGAPAEGLQEQQPAGVPGAGWLKGAPADDPKFQQLQHVFDAVGQQAGARGAVERVDSWSNDAPAADAVPDADAVPASDAAAAADQPRGWGSLE